MMAFIYPLAPLCLTFHFFFYIASPSLPSYCSCPFHSGRMPNIDDTYSMLWRQYQTSLFLKYKTTDDQDDQGIQSCTVQVSRVLLRVDQSNFTQKKHRDFVLNFNLAHCLSMFQLTGVKLTSANKPFPTNLVSNQSCLLITPRQPFKWGFRHILSLPMLTLHIL